MDAMLREESATEATLAHTLFLYDEASGVLRRRTQQGPACAGDVAGSDNGFGYVRINFNGKLRLRSHIVWLMHYNRWPTKTLDHINGKRGDDRISNLREVSLAHNLHNKRGANKNNTLGVRGVVQRGKRFAAYIVVNGKQKQLGTYTSCTEAAKVYEQARRNLHVGYLPEVA